MRWVVKLGEKTYLPKRNDTEAHLLMLPVTITFAATFRTKKSAIAAFKNASAYAAYTPIYEKREL